MPIRLNLLREHQEAEAARRRDPVKRAVLGGVVLVVCMLAWAMVLQFKAMRSNAEFSGIQGRVQAIDKVYKQVLENKKSVLETEERLIALQRLTTNRFLWGSALHSLQHLLADTEGISITRVRGEQIFLQQAESKPKTPKEGTARRQRVGRPHRRQARPQGGDAQRWHFRLYHPRPRHGADALP